ncbi:MAG: CrcB family protein [Deltaproteobacteria bacterium]|nr:CrcB family protein [Deltaproteobacteria bacterium]
MRDLWLYFAVGVGSAAGGMARYAVARNLAGRLWHGVPLATWFVNFAGSAVFGALVARQAHRPVADVVYLAITTGILGGFTTYSTFNTELLRQLQAGRIGDAMVYAAVTGSTCLLGAGLAYFAFSRP